MRQLVTQPIAGDAQHFDMLAHETQFFIQLTVERILRRFILIDAALRKLPGFLPDPLCP